MTRSAAAVRQADATLGPATSFTTSYTPNAVNQYAQIDPPQAIEVAGLTVPEVTQVSVNGAPTTGRPPGNGEPGGFSLWLEGAALGTWPQVSIQATRTGARANGSDLTTVRSGHVYVRPQEIPTYDPDGNLLSDTAWQYEWDADNRLILAQQKEPGLPADMAQKRIKYHYDWMSRLVAREESERRTLNDGTGLRSDTWTLVKTTHYYYDGWNVMAEVESGATVSVAGSPSPKVRRYLHGLDLSNTHEVGLANGPRTSTTATGGVGTLLGVIAPDDRLHTACTEVNGNLTGFIEASTGALAARFDYDAFGNVVTDWSAPGHNAAEITQLRFSTKLQDPETGWLFYGHRWYDPVNGRWTAKDPIAERGGLNLYAMVGNDAVNGVDVLGLAGIKLPDAEGYPAVLFVFQLDTQYKNVAKKTLLYPFPWHVEAAERTGSDKVNIFKPGLLSSNATILDEQIRVWQCGCITDEEKKRFREQMDRYMKIRAEWDQNPSMRPPGGLVPPDCGFETGCAPLASTVGKDIGDVPDLTQPGNPYADELKKDPWFNDPGEWRTNQMLGPYLFERLLMSRKTCKLAFDGKDRLAKPDPAKVDKARKAGWKVEAIYQ